MPALFAALLTPFSSSTGGVRHDIINQHLRWLEAQGLDGVVPCGTTGEGPSLTLDERLAVIDTVLAQRGRLRVVPGTGCAALPDTIKATRHAIERGAEAALVLPPFFFKNLSDEGLLAYYQAVCEALPAGGKIMLYHIPPVSQVPITTGLLDGLMASHPERIFGLKDSGRDAEYTALLVRRYPSLQIFTGSAGLFAQALDDGAAGGIFALANVFPRELRAIASGHASGDAAPAQEQVRRIDVALKAYAPVPALKALLPGLADLPPSSVRAPLVDLPDAERAALEQQVRALGAGG